MIIPSTQHGRDAVQYTVPRTLRFLIGQLSSKGTRIEAIRLVKPAGGHEATRSQSFIVLLEDIIVALLLLSLGNHHT